VISTLVRTQMRRVLFGTGSGYDLAGNLFLRAA